MSTSYIRSKSGQLKCRAEGDSRNPTMELTAALRHPRVSLEKAMKLWKTPQFYTCKLQFSPSQMKLRECGNSCSLGRLFTRASLFTFAYIFTLTSLLYLSSLRLFIYTLFFVYVWLPNDINGFHCRYLSNVHALPGEEP